MVRKIALYTEGRNGNRIFLLHFPCPQFLSEVNFQLHWPMFSVKVEVLMLRTMMILNMYSLIENYNVLEESVAFMFISYIKDRGSRFLWNNATFSGRLHDVSFHNIVILIFTTVRNSNFEIITIWIDYLLPLDSTNSIFSLQFSTYTLTFNVHYLYLTQEILQKQNFFY